MGVNLNKPGLKIKAICMLLFLSLVFTTAAPADTDGIKESLHYKCIPDEEMIYIAGFFPRSSPFSNSRAKNRIGKKKWAVQAEADTREHYRLFLEKISKLTALINGMAEDPEPYQQVLIFWQLGEQIAREKALLEENTAYHQFLMENLSNDTGIEQGRLIQIELFYRRYAVAATLSMQLAWKHYEILINIENESIRRFYQSLAVEKKWSPEELASQIRKNLYEKITS